jgi:hypothetical protein
VGTSGIIMVDPITKQSAQMPLTQGYEEVQALASHRPDQTFAIGIRLGRLRRGSQHSQPESLGQLLVEFCREDRVAIVDEKAVSTLAGNRFP